MGVYEKLKQRILNSEMMQFGTMQTEPKPEGKTLSERFPPMAVDWDGWYMSYAKPLAEKAAKDGTVDIFKFCSDRGGKEIADRLPGFGIEVASRAKEILESQGYEAMTANYGYFDLVVKEKTQNANMPDVQK